MLIPDQKIDFPGKREYVGGKYANDNAPSEAHILVDEHLFAETFGITGMVMTNADGVWEFIDPCEIWAPLWILASPKNHSGTTGDVLQWKARR